MACDDNSGSRFSVRMILIRARRLDGSFRAQSGEYVNMRREPDCSQTARMVKSADTADLKSADPNRSWGFKSPSGHHYYQ